MSASPEFNRSAAMSGTTLAARCTDGGANDGLAVELTCNSSGALNTTTSVAIPGVATAANQATQITAEQAILAKIVAAPALANQFPSALGQHADAGSTSVTLSTEITAILNNINNGTADTASNTSNTADRVAALTAGPNLPESSCSTVAAQSVPITWQIPVTSTPASIAPDWAASTAYVLGVVVTNDGGNLYLCITAGTSAGSGGPTGTNSDITDGTVHWRYISDSAAFKGSFVLRSLSTNSAAIFYGNSNLTKENGAELPAGQAEPVFSPNASAVYVCSASANLRATVVAYP